MPDTATKALAEPVASLDETALYTITAKVGSDDYALTLLPLAQRVELAKPNGKPEQQWQPHRSKVEPTTYVLLSRVTEERSTSLTGAMRLASPDRRFLDDEAYVKKFNLVTVGVGHGETAERWYIVQLPNGKCRIMSALGHPANLNTNDAKADDKWDEARWLTAVFVDGKVQLRHQRAANLPSQEWTLSKVGTYFEP